MLLHAIMLGSSLCCTACAFRCGLRGNRTVQATALLMLAAMLGMAVLGSTGAMLWAALLLASALALGPGIRRAAHLGPAREAGTVSAAAGPRRLDIAVATHRCLSFIATAGLFLAHATHSGTGGTSSTGGHHHGGALTASAPEAATLGTILLVAFGGALLVALARSGRLRSLATLDVAAMSAMLAAMAASTV